MTRDAKATSSANVNLVLPSLSASFQLDTDVIIPASFQASIVIKTSITKKETDAIANKNKAQANILVDSMLLKLISKPKSKIGLDKRYMEWSNRLTIRINIEIPPTNKVNINCGKVAGTAYLWDKSNDN